MNASHPRRRVCRTALWRAAPTALAIAAGLLVTPAFAKEAHYDVTHRMTIKPNADFGGEWQAGWRYVVGQVRATYDGVKVQPKSLKGQIEPFTGVGSPKTLDAAIGGASAHGASGATVSFGSGAQPFNGTINVNGFAIAEAPPGHTASAFASSQSLLVAGLKRTSSSGNVSWNSVTSISAAGCTRPCVDGHDPLGFELIDPNTGDLLTGTLLDIDLSVSQGDGEMTWQDGILTVASGQKLSGAFTIDRSSPFTTTHGTLSLRFVDNIVVESIATGIYSGLAPAVGASALGGFNFGEPPVDYDFGFGNASLPIDFTFGNSGMATVAVPEPASWALLIGGFALAGAALRRRRALAWAAR